MQNALKTTRKESFLCLTIISINLHDDCEEYKVIKLSLKPFCISKNLFKRGKREQQIYGCVS